MPGKSYVVYTYENYEGDQEILATFKSEEEAKRVVEEAKNYHKLRPEYPDICCGKAEVKEWEEKDEAWIDAHPLRKIAPNLYRVFDGVEYIEVPAYG